MTQERQEKPSDDVIERIKKMLRIAEDNRGNENEAAIAASMAEKLMRKYNLDFSDLVMKDLENDDSIQSAFAIDDADYDPSRAPSWINSLSVQVARLFDCGVRFRWKPGYRSYGGNEPRRYANFKFFGYRTDLEVCRWTFDFLVREINRLTEKYYDQLRDPNSSLTGEQRSLLFRASAKSIKRSYRIGASHAVHEKLSKMIAERDLERKGSSTSTALVITKQQRIEEMFGEFKYGNTQGSEIWREAHEAGKRDGRNINIHTPVGGTPADDTIYLGYRR